MVYDAILTVLGICILKMPYFWKSVAFNVVFLEAPESVTSMTELSQGNGTTTPINAANYLNRHIMFFTTRTAKNIGTESSPKYVNQYNGFIDNPISFELPLKRTTTEGVTTVEGDIYWVWPRTFGQVVLADGNSDDAEYLQGGFPILNTAGEANDRSKVTGYLTSKWQLFFQQPQNQTTAIDYGDQLAALYDTRATTPEPGDFQTQYSVLSEGYNTADQSIGKNIRYCLVVMTVNG